MSRLERLEEAEGLVVELLRAARDSICELKHVRSGSEEKGRAFLQHVERYFTCLSTIRDLVLSELAQLQLDPGYEVQPGRHELARALVGARELVANLEKLAVGDDGVVWG